MRVERNSDVPVIVIVTSSIAVNEYAVQMLNKQHLDYLILPFLPVVVISSMGGVVLGSVVAIVVESHWSAMCTHSILPDTL